MMINFILPVQEMRETKHMDGTMNHFGHLPITYILMEAIQSQFLCQK
jgi:hypothetical protein